MRELWARTMERLERRPLLLTAIAVLVALLATAAMAVAAGPGGVEAAIERIAPLWIAIAVGARLLAYLGYTLAHHRVMSAGEDSELEADTAARVVAFGAGATSLRGGFSIDARAMRGAGESRPRARAHVAALAMMEYAVLAAGAWISALLLIGSAGVQGGVVWPWAIGVPAGTAIAVALYVLLAPRVGRGGGAVRKRVRSVLDGGGILAEQSRRPGRAAAAIGGMVLYWCAEVAALWASLRAFDVTCSAQIAIVGFATGYVLTPRGLPLAGAGIAEVLVPLALHWLGLPLAPAVVAAFTAELTRLAVSVPFTLAAARGVRELVDAAG